MFSKASMAMFYFHLRQGDVLVEDVDGSDLDDLPAALAEALDDARFLIAEMIRFGKMVEPWSIQITDSSGMPLKDVHFHDVVLGTLRR
jgi:hypothetical protein